MVRELMVAATQMNPREKREKTNKFDDYTALTRVNYGEYIDKVREWRSDLDDLIALNIIQYDAEGAQMVYDSATKLLANHSAIAIKLGVQI